MKNSERGEYFIQYASEPPSLQNIALVSITISLWTEPDLIGNIKQYSKSFGFDTRTESAMKAYNEFRERTLNKLSDLFLPDSLKIKVVNLIQPIGFQLLKGFAKPIEYNCNSRFLRTFQDKECCRFYDIFKLGGSVNWTMEGIIDNVSSLKELINNKDQAKDFHCLFELACNYCLKEYIPDLWRKIPKCKTNTDGIYENYDHHIVEYWIASMENELPNWWEKMKGSDHHNVYDNNLSIHQNMISLSVFVSNPYSLKYFWHKLKKQEKDANVRNWITRAIRKYDPEEIHEYQNYKNETTILCFLLSQLDNEKQQKEVFRIHSKIILKALFFHWPWQKFFLPTITTMLPYVPEQSFVDIMSLVAEEIKEERTTVDIFREIWLKSSLKLKKSFFYFLTHSQMSCTVHKDNTSALYRFIEINDLETIFMILEYANRKEKKGILFNMIANYELYHVIDSNKLSLIEILLTKCLPSARFINKLKNFILLRHANDLSKEWIESNNFQAVETFLKWGFQSSKQLKRFKKNIIDGKEILTSLVCLGDYELIDRFMNWYFESEDEIDKFKKAYIFEVNDDSPTCISLLVQLSYHEKGWELFEKFINYIFGSLGEMPQFKNMILESITYFLRSNKFEFASKFVNWCLGSADKVNQFKNLFVLTDKAIELILFAVNTEYPTWSNVGELIKWFSITKMTAVDIKYRLDDKFLKSSNKIDVDDKRRGLFHLLDKYAVSNNSEINDDSEIKNTDSSDMEMKIMKIPGTKL